MAISGRNVYVYVAGATILKLKGFTANITNSVIDLDPDISSVWRDAANGFLGIRGTIDYNFNSTDYEANWDSLVGNAAVGLYLYPETGASKTYVYGSAWLSDLGLNSSIGATTSGTLGFSSTGTWGRQNTAA